MPRKKKLGSYQLKQVSHFHDDIEGDGVGFSQESCIPPGWHCELFVLESLSLSGGVLKNKWVIQNMLLFLSLYPLYLNTF